MKILLQINVYTLECINPGSPLINMPYKRTINGKADKKEREKIFLEKSFFGISAGNCLLCH